MASHKPQFAWRPANKELLSLLRQVAKAKGSSVTRELDLAAGLHAARSVIALSAADDSELSAEARDRAVGDLAALEGVAYGAPTDPLETALRGYISAN